MAIRPSHKLEPSDQHELIEVERVPDGGVAIDIWGIGLLQDDEPHTVSLSYEEATELAAMLRSVLEQPLSTEDAAILRLDGNKPVEA